MKAYIHGGMITLAPENASPVSFMPGQAITNLKDEKENSPYALFKGANIKDLISRAKTSLKKLYDLFEEEAFSPAELIYQMDLTDYPFSVSFEAVEEIAVCVFNLKNASDLFALELILAIQSGKPLKICENCGEYFFPAGRSDALYCDRIGIDGYSCKKIGAHRLYRKNSRADSVKALYDKTTKHNRYLKNQGKISEREYMRWMQTVSEIYSDYKIGRASESTLRARLSETLTETQPRSARGSISDYLL